MNNAPAAAALTRTSGSDRHLNSLYPVVAESRQVPRRLERLHVTCGVGGAARELMAPRRCRPRCAPPSPAQIPRWSEVRVAPHTVQRPLHAGDRRAARPGAPGERDLAGLHGASARIEVRNARRHHQGIDAHERARLALLVRATAEVIAARLLEAVECVVDGLD